MIYLVTRIDFDVMENHDPERTVVEGFGETVEEAQEFVARRTEATTVFVAGHTAWRDKTYPRWEIKPVHRLPMTG